MTLALVLAGLLMAAAGFAAAGLAAVDAHRRALAEAGREVRNLSFLLADHTDRAMQAIELALASTLERAQIEGALAGPEAFAAWAQGAAVHAALAERIAALPQIDALLLVDAGGTLLASSRFFPPPPRDLSDRAYFQESRDNLDGLAIGPPVLNRGTNTWAFHIAQRIRSTEEDFLGIVVAVVELASFEGLYGSIALGSGSSVYLFRSDGVLMVRHPAMDSAIGRELGGSSRFQLAVANSDGQTFRIDSQIDGRDRLVSARALADFPLRVHVGIAVQDAIVGARAVAFELAVGAVLLAGVVAAAVALALRAARAESLAAGTTLRRERELAAERLAHHHELTEERLAHERQLSERHADFRVVVESMSPVVWRFGPDGRLALANERGVEVLGLRAGAARVGATPGEIARAASAAGATGTAVAIDRLATLAAAREAASFVQDLGSGRAASVALRSLPDGGWLATFEDISEQRAAEARARYLATHDPLTGLANRRQLEERLAEALAGRPAERIALLMVDLDRFKQVNDALGHPAGDALLRAAAERIQANVRSAQADGRAVSDLVARPGGDEFAVMLAGLSGDADTARAIAKSVAARLVAAFSAPFVLAGQQALVGASIGLALFPEDGATPEEITRAADLALYRAKADGRGRHCLFDRSLDEAARTRRELELDLQRALLDESGARFEVHFQPVVDVATRAPQGCEALVRWRRTGRDVLSGPSEFVPLAEEAGLIVQLGALVLRRACRVAAGWSNQFWRVAVNLSPAQVHADGFVEMVESALAEVGLDPSRLELEITEGVLLRGTEEALAAMRRLRTIGVRFAMDDFGTGYSSLSYLRTFPFDRVKIDRSFVREIEGRPQDAAIVRAIVSMCAELGIETVAEGVETEGQLAILAAAGCHEAQGYLLGRPMPDNALWAMDGRCVPAGATASSAVSR